MSKKLIAVAAAAALALTGLVAAPANSAVGAFSVTVKGEISGNGLTDTPFKINVPTQDVLRYTEEAVASGTDQASTLTAVRVSVVTPGTTDVVRITTTGGAKVLTKTAFTNASTKNTALGSTSAEEAGVLATAGETEFVVFTTSTTKAQVTVTSGANSSSFWIVGQTKKEWAYNVVAKNAPATLATSVDTKVDFTVTDAFGNAIEETLDASISKVGAVTLSTATALTWDTDRKTLYLTVSGNDTGSAASVSVSLGATKVTAFGTPKTVFFTTAVGGTLAEQITALTAQVAALTTQLANSVSKAKYNKLAKRWNKANPSNKVKLQK